MQDVKNASFVEQLQLICSMEETFAAAPELGQMIGEAFANDTEEAFAPCPSEVVFLKFLQEVQELRKNSYAGETLHTWGALQKWRELSVGKRENMELSEESFVVFAKNEVGQLREK